MILIGNIYYNRRYISNSINLRWEEEGGYDTLSECRHLIGWESREEKMQNYWHLLEFQFNNLTKRF